MSTLALALALALVTAAADADGAGTAGAKEGPAQRERVLVLDARGALSDDERRAVTQLLAARMAARLGERRPPVEVISGADLRTLVELQGDKGEAGCDTDACLTELAGALDARYVVSTEINQLGEAYVVALGVFDAKAARTLSRRAVEARDAAGAADRARDAIDEMLREAFPEQPGSGGDAASAPGNGTVGVALGAFNGLRLAWSVGPVDLVATAGLGLLAVQATDGAVSRDFVSRSGASIGVNLSAGADLVFPLRFGDGAWSGYGGVGAHVGPAGAGVVEVTDPFGFQFVLRAPLGVRVPFADRRLEVSAEVAPALVLGGATGFLVQPTLGVAYVF